MCLQPPLFDTVSQDEINAILWKAFDTFRGTIDPSEYKNYLLVMLFLKYLSDIHAEHREQYQQQFPNDPERVQRRLERDTFRLPDGSDFYALYEARSLPDIGECINIALETIEAANRAKLEGVFRNIDVK